MKEERKKRIEAYRKGMENVSNPMNATTTSALFTGEVNLALTEAVENLQLQVSEATKELIDSNARLSESSDRHARAMVRYARAMVYLTLALVFVGMVEAGIVQALIAWVAQENCP